MYFMPRHGVRFDDEAETALVLVCEAARSSPSEVLERGIVALAKGLGQLGKYLDLSSPALEALARYDWPGNVRELRNPVERAVVLADGSPTLRIWRPIARGWASPIGSARQPHRGAAAREHPSGLTCKSARPPPRTVRYDRRGAGWTRTARRGSDECGCRLDPGLQLASLSRVRPRHRYRGALMGPRGAARGVGVDGSATSPRRGQELSASVGVIAEFTRIVQAAALLTAGTLGGIDETASRARPVVARDRRVARVRAALAIAARIPGDEGIVVGQQASACRRRPRVRCGRRRSGRQVADVESGQE